MLTGPDLPALKETRDLISGLIGKEISLQPTAPLAPGPRVPASIAVYVDDRMQMVALHVCDLPLSAFLGAAIALQPLGDAEASIDAGTLDPTLGENFAEVLNVAASLFNTTDVMHVRLHQTIMAGEPIPQHLRAAALGLGRREDLLIEVPGYGSGRWSTVLTY